MPALSVSPPFPIFTDTDGQPLENGYVWIGTANLNPITNPVAVFWDAALTQPAAQPIRTLNGYPSNAGTPGRLYVASDYSIQVQNKNGSVVYSAPDGASDRFSAAQISFLQAGTGAVARTAQAKMRDVVSVKDFGAVGDGVADDTAAMQAARNFIAAQSQTPKLVFPSGIYKYNNSPNWAIQDAEIIANGEVRLRYTGTDNAVVIDADGAGAVVVTAGLCYNVRMTHFIVEAPATAKNGVYVRSIHHSNLGFDVRGAGATYSGIRVEFAVCTIFEKPTVSINKENWYLGAKPQDGLYLTRRNVAEECSYCTFSNPILEATNTGAVLEWALGNTFIGGTMEGCTNTGVSILTNSRLNKFFNVDFEFNTVVDIYCGGYQNEFYGCDSDKYSIIPSGGKQNLFIGGSYQEFVIGAGAEDNTIVGLRYNRFGSAFFSDSGTRTRLRDLHNLTTNQHHNTILTQSTLAVGVSPYTYQNTSANDETITISGGVVTAIYQERNNVGNLVGFTNGQVTLSTNDKVTVNYTVAPSMLKLTR